MLDNIRVLVLVGGRGTRLKEVVSDVPKPMAPIGNTPFLEYLIRNLKAYGFCRFSLLSGYKTEVIEEHFKSWEGVNVVAEGQPLGTGGAIINVMEKIKEEKVLVVNGDTYFNGDPLSLIFESGSDFLNMGLTMVDDISRYGAIVVGEDEVIVEMKEKEGKTTSGLINLGMYYFDKSLMNKFVSMKKCSLETDIFPKLISVGAIHGKVLSGDFIDIGIPEDYSRAQDLIPQWFNS